MSKKMTPSGYQIIVIDSSHIDDDNYLIIDNEDAKILKEILSSDKPPKKPILLCDENTTLMGFATYFGKSLSIIHGEVELDGDWASCVSLVLELQNDGNILVTENEI